jgi:hypothetical protein
MIYRSPPARASVISLVLVILSAYLIILGPAGWARAVVGPLLAIAVHLMFLGQLPVLYKAIAWLVMLVLWRLVVGFLDATGGVIDAGKSFTAQAAAAFLWMMNWLWLAALGLLAHLLDMVHPVGQHIDRVLHGWHVFGF